MASPVRYTPKEIDPRNDVQRELAQAPERHAEALLVAYGLLEEAHKQGILDALHGAIGARDTILGLIADYSAEKTSVQALRNLLSLAKVLGSIDPELLSKIAKALADPLQTSKRNEGPPSLWQLFKRLREPDTRRGISLATNLLSAVGRAAK